MPAPAVIDTMLFAYALLGVTNRREAALAALAAARPLYAPDSLRAELANVVWQWVRQRHVSIEFAHTALQRADGLVDQYASSGELWHAALDLAAAAGHPVYDTLFVALAQKRGAVVVSDDGKLARAFPDWVVSPEVFVAGADFLKGG